MDAKKFGKELNRKMVEKFIPAKIRNAMKKKA